MELSEYKEKLKKIEEDLGNKKMALAKEFAFSNSTVKIGDTITDRIGSITVEEIKYYPYETPLCIYIGFEAKKDKKMKPKKRDVWQSNLISINGINVVKS